jgi:hypothetical protein
MMVSATTTGVSSEILEYRLRQVVGVDPLFRDGRAHVTLGGSHTSGIATPASDIDLLVLTGAKELNWISTLGALKKVDVEYRSLDWFEEFSRKLAPYSVNVSGALPPFNYMDLRFAARLALGKAILMRSDVEGWLSRIREPLRLALAQYYSTVYLNIYEDIYGFYLSEMYDCALLASGGLIQTAAELSLLQSILVDPAPKSAVARSGVVATKSVQQRLQNCVSHLGCFDAGDPARWTRELLNGANSVIASASLPTIWKETCSSGSETFSFGADNEIGRQFADPTRCPFGLPGFPLILNIRSNGIEVANKAFLVGMSYWKGECGPLV